MMKKNQNEPTTVRLPRELLDAIDQFRREQDDIPSRPEAMRRIMQDWLIGNGYLSPEGGKDE